MQSLTCSDYDRVLIPPTKMNIADFLRMSKILEIAIFVGDPTTLPGNWTNELIVGPAGEVVHGQRIGRGNTIIKSAGYPSNMYDEVRRRLENVPGKILVSGMISHIPSLICIDLQSACSFRSFPYQG